MEFKNNIKKILTNKKDTLSTKLFIIDNLKKIINTKRIFIIDAKKKDIRGNHAHKKCTQVFISLNGRIKLEIYNGKKKKFYFLNPFKNILKVRPLHWVKVYFKKDQKLMVLCDQSFNKKDYIYSIDDLKFLTK